MRILILGAGATGGYFGARLTQAGADVTFLVRPARAAQLREQGLIVTSSLGDFHGPVGLALQSEVASAYDLILLSCKAYDLDAAMVSIGPAVGPHTVVLPLLNGLAHYDRLDTRFGRARIGGGCCHLAAMLDPGGAVRHLNAIHRITFGIRDGNADHARSVLNSLADLFARTSVECLHTENVMQELWEKYVFLCALASMTCLMRAAVGDIVAAEGGRVLMLEAFEVCAQTAARSAFPPRSAAREDAIRILTEPGSAFTASMLRDLEAGHRLESDHVIGDMLRRAVSVGVAPGPLRVASAHLLAHEARRAREAAA